MVFDYCRLLRQLLRSTFRTASTERRLTVRRLRFFAVFVPLFLYGEISSWICLALDHVLYPRFKRIDLAGKTLFIVGNFRSGSTFLHRLLAADSTVFTAPTTWEIYLAPSIIQRKILKGLKIVDGLFGAPLYRGLRSWDREFLQKIPLHSVSLWRPEEDVGFLLYVWYGLFSWFFFPDVPPVSDLIRFDERIPTPRRRRIVAFYAGCLKRHLFVHGAERIVVSKNPSFSPMMLSLRRFIPQSRFIALVRDPIDTLSSTLSWLSYAWHFFADPISQFPFREDIVDLVRHWFACVRRSDEIFPSDALLVVTFERLVDRPARTVESIYRFLGKSISDAQRRFLGEEETFAEGRPPNGRAALSEAGLDPVWLSRIFRDTLLPDGFSGREGPNTDFRSK